MPLENGSVTCWGIPPSAQQMDKGTKTKVMCELSGWGNIACTLAAEPLKTLSSV